MPSTLKSAMLVVLAIATLATPVAASARPASTQAVMHSKRPVSFYRESLRAQVQMDERFYSAPVAQSRGGSDEISYALIACVVVLVGAGTVAASRRERNGTQQQFAAAH